MSRYWLYNWLEVQGIASLRDAEARLQAPEVREFLKELALESRQDETPPVASGAAIVAGCGLDLSGYLDCSDDACRRFQVDRLFRQAWFYFDRIVVDDALTRYVADHWDGKSVQRELLSHIQVVLYLRSIGAEDLIEFREKRLCSVHFERHLREAGLEGLLTEEEKWITYLSQDADVLLRVGPKDNVEYDFRHPDNEVLIHQTLSLESCSRDLDSVRRHALRDILRRYATHLTADVMTARAAGLPLASTLWLHRQILQEQSRTPTAEDIAFSLSLPVLANVRVRDLIRIRRDNQDGFERFRDRLRQALRERLKTAGAATAPALAKEIERDLIEPELRAIRVRLETAHSTLTKKTAVGIFLGGLATTCGLLAGAVPVVAVTAGVGTLIAAAGTGAAKTLDEHRDIQLADMYFLWKAIGHRG